MKSTTTARLRARRAQAAGAALALASALYAFRGGAREAMKFTRFAEAEDEDEEDEDEVDKDIRLKLEGVVIIVSGMILLSIGFEQGREVLFHRTSESMRPILTSMFSELTTLGFISVTLFVIFTIPWMETLSESIYGEEEGSELDELSETVHMVLFLVMVLFLAQAIGLVALGNSIQKQWRLWETSSINKLPRSIVGYVEDISRRPFAVNLFTHRLPVPYRILVYKATRDTFVRNHLAKTPDFDFSAYLSACLGHTIAEIVEIPMNTWLFFELLLILCWVAFFNLTQDWGLVMWLVIGYFTGPILAAVLHAKIRGIVQMHCANDIREILKMLPHRYPFLLIDRVIEVEGYQRAVAIKNVTINEPFFPGHFPEMPLMPGVLQLEAMAQLAGMLLLRKLEYSGKLAVLWSLDKVKLRGGVTPGDQLRLEVETMRIKGETVQVKGRGTVAGKVVCEAVLMFTMIDA